MEKLGSQDGFAATLARIAAANGRSRLALLAEIAALRFGSGRLSFADYVGLRLFDRSFYPGADKTAFVGFHAAQKIWMDANFRVDLFGLVSHKLAADVLFAAHGFPVPQTFGLYRDRIGRACPFLVNDDGALRAFLTDDRNFPLFGKPIGGHQSLGSASLERYDARSDRLVLTTGQHFSVDDYMGYVKTHGASGYVFQRRISPHAAIRAICGNRLATVRLLTLTSNGKTTPFRACWKIPAGINAADNFWRPGNLLARLDLESGRVLHVMRGEADGYAPVAHHPDSKAALIGMTVPNWPDILRLALDAAKVVEDMALVGWDIAPTDDGAILVEMNQTPDFRLHQVADRRGILDGELRAFLAKRRQESARWRRMTQAHNRGQ